MRRDLNANAHMEWSAASTCYYFIGLHFHHVILCLSKWRHFCFPRRISSQ